MLKKYFLMGAFGLASSAIFGQAALIALLIGDKVASEKFNISMEIGAGLNTYSDFKAKNQPGLAINFGMGCNIKLNESWYLNPTVYFFSQRSLRLENVLVRRTINTGGLPLASDATISVSYIDLPVFINYRISESPWKVGIAPQISFLPNSTIDYQFNADESYRRKDKDNLNPVVFGMIASVSYVVSTGRDGKGLIIGLRYYQGLTDTFENDFNLANGSAKPSYIGLNLSFPFITDALADENKKPPKI